MRTMISDRKILGAEPGICIEDAAIVKADRGKSTILVEDSDGSVKTFKVSIQEVK